MTHLLLKRPLAIAALTLISSNTAMAQSPINSNQVRTVVNGSTSPGKSTDTGIGPLPAAAYDSLNDGGLDPHFTWSSSAAGYASGAGVGLLAHSNSFFTGVIGVDINGGANSAGSGSAVHRNTISVSSATLPNGTPVDLAFTTNVTFTSSTNLQGNGFQALAWVSLSLQLSNVSGGVLVGIQCGPNSQLPDCGAGFTTSQIVHTVVGGNLLLDVEVAALAQTFILAPNPLSFPQTVGAAAFADGFHSVMWTLDAVTPGVTYTTASGETYVSTNPIGPTASAFALPNVLNVGDPTTLMAPIHLPSNSTSTGIGMTVDLSSIGGGPQVALFDDGTHGDVDANDNIFALPTAIALGTSPGLKSLPVTVFDAQGRSTQTTIVISINTPLDAIPPTTSALASPGPNVAGWNNANVTVNLSSVDNTGGSGVQQFAYTLTGAQTGSAVVTGNAGFVTISVEGVTTLTYFATDNIGNQEALRTLIVRIDKTLPTLTATRTPLPNTAGWNNTAVTVSFQCSDALSGLAAGSPSAPVTISTNGSGQSVNGTCADLAGNGVLLTVQPINIDAIAPLVIAPPSQTVQQSNATGAIVTYPKPSSTETGSGIATSGCTPVSGSNFPVGITTVTCSATDRAGNTGVSSFTITVTAVHRKFPKG
ncbi:unnamed protein product [uncultured bacterium]|nr:unnamed protein product [uncultured bacterium]